MKIFLLFLTTFFFISFSSPSSAQSSYEKDSLAIKAVMDSAKTLLNQHEFPPALALLNRAGQLLQVYPDSNTNMYAYWYEYQGYAYYYDGQVTKAIGLFEKSIEVYRRSYPVGDIHLAVPLYNYGVLCKLKHDFKRSREYLQEVLQIRMRHVPESIETGQTWSALGALEYDMGNYSDATRYIQKAEEIFQKYPENFKARESIATVYLNMANIYDEWGDYDRAIEFYRKSLSIRKANMKKDDSRIATCLSLLGNSYENKLDLDNAETSYREALRICTANAPDVDSSELAICFENIASLLNKKKNYPEAIQYQNQCINIRRQCQWLGIGRVADAQVLLAQIYKSAGNLDSAAWYARQAITIWDESYEEIYPATRLDGWLMLAEVQLLRDNIDEAWQLTEEALKHNKKSSDEDFERGQHTFILRARICNARYKKSGQLSDLQAAIPALKTILDLRSTQQQRFGRSGSRLTSAALLYPVAEEALDICTKLYEITQDKSVADLAFKYMEQTKSTLLRLSINEMHILFADLIPNNLSDQESFLMFTIAEVEAERDELLMTGTPLNDPEILELDSHLFELNQQTDSLKNIIQQKYPAYFQARYNTTTIDLNDLQQHLLKKEQTLLSYFWGEQDVYVIGIQKEGVFLKQLPGRMTLESSARQLLQEVRTPKKESDGLITSARSLYNNLIAPVASRLTEELIVVPDGLLNYLPFEVLLSRQPEHVYRYHTFPYLLLSHQISYAPSATIWQEMVHKIPSPQHYSTLAAFAPFYEGNPGQLVYMPELDTMRRQTFEPLPHSGEEVYSIEKIIGGEVFFRNAATVTRFDSVAPRSRIIHLATHGKANDRSGDFSYMAFLGAIDTTQCDLLLARDLYKMRLQADLVTLSACETGAGEMRRGEGVISLARAFVMAGAKSIVTSLWAVNDASTRHLMVGFYTNLKKGMTKDKALASAKRQYIKNYNPTAHPYYWAPFVAIGDMQALWR
ncbi:MAG: CHAT domain-containing protein [Bacteroidetes bacterium]|nr:CHAT domain-containing protein [Bacteroidota bacterium]